MTLLQLAQLMRELGPHASDISEIIQDDDRCWSVCWDDRLWVALEFRSKPERLLLCAVLGSPDPSRRLAIHAAMLGANALFAAEGSLRIALNYPDQALLLLNEYKPELWTVQGLSAEIRQFVAHATALIREIRRDVSSGTEIPALHSIQKNNPALFA